MEVVWLILKIIGIILLAALGIILCLILVVLFVPVRYKAELEKQDVFKVRAEATWLLRLLRIKILYEEGKPDVKVKLLFFGLYPKKDKGKTADGSVTDDGQKSDETAEVQKAEAQTAEKQEEALKEAGADKNTPPESSRVESKPEESVQKESTPHESTSTKKTKLSFGKKKKKPSQKKGSAIAVLKAFLNNQDNVLGILKTLESIKKLLKHIFPKKVSGRLYFGTGDPCTTGQILGLLAAIYGFYGESLTICPDFLEKRFETELKIKGRIIIFSLLVTALRLLFNKQFKLLIKNFKELKKELGA